MPRAARWTSISRAKGAVTTSAVGMPVPSSSTVSRVQHDAQEPQSPMAVRTTSHSPAIRATSSGGAGREKASFL